MSKRTSHRRKLNDARAQHDARFAVDFPKPTANSISRKSTGLEIAAGYLWLIWLILAIAGAIISAPHTLATLRAVLPGANDLLLFVYSVAGFVGVEFGLIGLALVSALANRDDDARKIATMKGFVNWLCIRIGNAPMYDLSHLPERKRTNSGALVVGLFVAAIVFNQVDALRDVLPKWRDDMLLISRSVTGVLGPGLLLISGHRFAIEIVASGERSQHDRLARAIDKWQSELNSSWVENSDKYLSGTVENQPTTTAKSTAQQVDLNPRQVENQPLTGKLLEQVEQCARLYDDQNTMTLAELGDAFGVSTQRAGVIRAAAVDAGYLEKVGRSQFKPNGRVK